MKNIEEFKLSLSNNMNETEIMLRFMNVCAKINELIDIINKQNEEIIEMKRLLELPPFDF